MTPTPGQGAYEAFGATMEPLAPWGMPPYAELSETYRRGWEAAAQAVQAGTPRFQFALGQHVRRTGDAAHLWEIWWRSCREEIGRTFIDYGLRLVDPASDYQPCRMSDGTDLTSVEDEG